MALSGSMYTNVGSHWRLQIEWTATQDITANTSYVTAKMYWIGLDSYSAVYSSATKDGAIIIDGTTYTFSGAGLAGLSAGQKKLLATKSKTISHNSDGTGDFTLDGYFDAEVTLGSYVGRIDMTAKTFTLNTIPRASSLTSTSQASWTAGNNASFGISRASSSFTHTIKIYVDNVLIKTLTGVTTSASSSFSTTDNTKIFTELAQTASKSTKIELLTYSGSTHIGTKTYTGTCTAPNRSTTSWGGDFYIGNTMSGTITDYHSSFTHKIQLIFGSSTFTIIDGHAGGSWSYDTDAIATSLYNLTPNSNTLSGYIRIYTYYNGVQVRDYAQSTVKAMVDPSISSPTFSLGGTYKDTNATTVGITGNDQYIIQSKSTVEVRVPLANKATAKNGATMSSYVATLNGTQMSASYSTSADVVFSFGAVSASVNITLSIKAVDSRGNSTEWTKTVNIVPYSSPAMVRTATRTNSFENETTLALNGSISAISVGGTQKNAVTDVKYRYREKGSSTWGTYSAFTYTASGANYTATNVVLNLDNTKAFEVEFYVADKLSYSAQVVTVSSGQPVLFIDTGKKSIGVNMFPANSNALDVTGAIKATGDITANGAVFANGGLNFNNKALIANWGSTSNIDHIWHDDSTNSWHFVSDGADKAQGNSTLVAGGAELSYLNVNASGDTSATATNLGIRVGSETGLNVKIDGNEIIANNNGALSPLYLQTDGGRLSLFNNTSTPLHIEDGFITQQAKQYPSLLNGWVNYGSSYAATGYWKDKNGWVHLVGLIKSGTTTYGTNLFVLPAGYRPGAREIHVTFGADSTIPVRIDIQPTGEVIGLNGLNAGWTSLSGISFLAEN